MSHALTVDQLVSAAIKGNRDFLSAQQRIGVAQGLLKQASVGIAGSLEVSGLSGQAFGNAGEDSLTATYSHTFETFGKKRKRVQVAAKELALAQAESDERRRSLTYEIRIRYAEAAANQAKLVLIDHLGKVNQDYLRLTEARVQKGDAAPLEADLLRVDTNRDQARSLIAQGQWRSALLQLEAVLDSRQTGSLLISSSLAVPALTNDLETLKALAVRNRPDLRSLQLAFEQSQAQGSLANVETKPNLTVSGQYSHNDTAFDLFGLTSANVLTPLRDHLDAVGVGVSIPLTTARRNRGNIEAAVARQAEVRLRRDYLAGVIPSQVEAAYQHWQAARQAADIFTRGVVQQSENNLNVMRQAYTLGELRLVDVLNEQRRLLDTELSYIDTQADLFHAYAELEQAVGGPLQ
jgi:cobalt-zinc-cadmium efflux system outer membrane protein